MIRPPASQIFQSWGLGPSFEAISDTSLATFFRDMQTGRVATRNIAVDIAESPDWGTDREAAQKLLYDRACQAGASIEFGVVVEDVSDNAEEATVSLRAGATYKADLLLAADGIRSRIRSKILADVKEPIDPVVSKITLYGIRHPLEDLRSIPDAKPLIDNVNLNVWMGKRLQVVGRSSRKLGRFGALYGIVADYTDQKGLWDEVSHSYGIIKHFSPSIGWRYRSRPKVVCRHRSSTPGRSGSKQKLRSMEARRDAASLSMDEQKWPYSAAGRLCSCNASKRCSRLFSDS